MTQPPASSLQPPALLSFSCLQVAFGPTRVVHGLSFDIAPGQVVALVGESGSGKSVSAMSVLRLLQEPPANYPGGRILWRGDDVLRMDATRLRRLRGGHAGLITQSFMHRAPSKLRNLHT